MPVAVSYPGVYIQEIPSGVHTITGVSTSLTAFIGRTYRGPVNTPILINSFGDFQRFFGGLQFDFPLSYAVRDFFQNGGGQGVVVRLFGRGPATDSGNPLAEAAPASISVAGMAGFDAISAANAVLNAAGAAAAAKTDVNAAIAGVPRQYRNATPLVQAVVNAAVASATRSPSAGNNPVQTGGNPAPPVDGPATTKGAVPTPAEMVNNIAGAIVGILRGSTGIPNLPPAAPAAINDAQMVVTAVWTAALAEGANGTKVSEAATTAAAKGGDAAKHVAEAVTTAAAVPGATAASVAAAAGNAVQGAVAQSSTPVLNLNASSPGDWPNGVLTVKTDTSGITEQVAQAVNASLAPGDLFNLGVTYTASDGTTTSELFRNVSVREDAGAVRLDRVLANASNFIRYSGAFTPAPGATPASATAGTPSGGDAAATGTSAAGEVTSQAGGAGGAQAEPEKEQGSETRQGSEAEPPANLSGPTPPAVIPPLSGATGTAAGGTASARLLDTDYLGNLGAKTGMYALENFDLFNLMVLPMDGRLDAPVPPTVPGPDVFENAAMYCRQRRAFLLVEPPAAWTNLWKQGELSSVSLQDVGSYGPEGQNAAVYFPRICEQDPLMASQSHLFSASGAIAGIYARTDAARGVWKAPAGVSDGAISGIQQLEISMTDADNGVLNPLGINCLRSFPVYGGVVWGARTLKGADQLTDDYKYIPIRRLALYIEESLYRGTKWAVFEPNAEPLWAGLRLSVGSFMNQLFRQGAFAGSTASDAYYVNCDATTTTQADIDAGIVNVNVGFAPLKPAEFVVISIQQIAGQLVT